MASPISAPATAGRGRFHPIVPALLAAAALVALLAAGIHLFGDPAAGGPRSSIALQGPGPTQAAAATPFAEAAAAGAAAPWVDADTGLDTGLAPADPAAATGEVRVTLVEGGRVAAAPLPRAPLAGLHAPGPRGPIPVVAPDGRTAARAYARPFTDPGKPKIAIMVGGLGFNRTATQMAIDELPAEVTLSFVPYAADLQSWIDRARANGHEVMIELPMEPFDQARDDTGPQTLLASRDLGGNIGRLEDVLSRAAGYFAVTNYQGSRFVASAQAAGPVASALKARGLALITSGVGQRTALSAEAGRAGLPSLAADRIIDARQSAAAIDEQLLNLEAIALQQGAALGSGFAFPVTIDQVNRWSQAIASRGYVLAPASAVLDARTARR